MHRAEGLLSSCGVEDVASWRQQWLERLAQPDLPEPVVEALGRDPGLLWGVALPLISRLSHGVATQGSVLIGLNGPVGAGKTSLGRLLQALAPLVELRLAVASIDDLYRPWSERRSRLQGNPFGVNRVPPGSHDPELLLRQLEPWRHNHLLRLPQFDKRLRNGEGDRNGWTTQEADAVVLEGWLLGCLPLGAGALGRRLEQLGGAAGLGLSAEEAAWLPRWDQELEAYQPAWSRLDGLWVLRPQQWGLPRRWRLQAEARQRRSGAGALPPEQLNQLVQASLRSLPPPLYQDPVAVAAEALAVLDGRRRCRWSGTGAEASHFLDQLDQLPLDQLSVSSAVSSIG